METSRLARNLRWRLTGNTSSLRRSGKPGPNLQKCRRPTLLVPSVRRHLPRRVALGGGFQALLSIAQRGNRTQAGSLRYITLSRHHSGCTAIALGWRRDRWTVRKTMQRRLPACVLFAPAGKVFQVSVVLPGLYKPRVETSELSPVSPLGLGTDEP
jgi:hypothetical protein